jgi:very-short-patch-repair endonuclease
MQGTTAHNNKQVEIVCELCGKAFKVRPSRIGRSKYCSIACANKGKVELMRRVAVYSFNINSTKRTNIEVKMAELLSICNITYIEQEPLYEKWIADFVLYRFGIVIFCDGIYWHSKPKVAAKDKGQTRYLEKCGWKVLRFTDKEILKAPEYCISKILANLTPSTVALPSQQSPTDTTNWDNRLFTAPDGSLLYYG